MTFSGFEKTDLINYPGLVASTVFTCGCNFRCPYCHNPEFVVQGSDETYFGETYTEDEIIAYINKRRALLDGLVISGGEPTLHKDLPAFIARVKEMGLKVKLDTNGSRPDVLEDLVGKGLLDYVAMDIKAPLEKYILLGFNDTESVFRSIRFLKTCGVDHEFRTTCPKRLLVPEDFGKMSDLIGKDSRWYLQTFNPGKTLDPSYRNVSSFSADELREIAHTLGMPYVVVR